MILAAENPRVSRTGGRCRLAGRSKAWRPSRRRRAMGISIARGDVAPQLDELAGQFGPHVFDRLQNPCLKSGGRRATRVAAGGQRAEEVADHGADIEAHRPIEGEFRVDHPRLVLGHHDRTGMEIAMDHRFRIAQEF